MYIITMNGKININRRIINQFTELKNIITILLYLSDNVDKKLAYKILIKNYNYIINIISKSDKQITSIYLLKDYNLSNDVINKIDFIIKNPLLEVPTLTKYKYQFNSYHIKNKTVIDNLKSIIGDNLKLVVEFGAHKKIFQKHIKKIKSIEQLINYVKSNKIVISPKAKLSLLYHKNYKIKIPYDEITNYDNTLSKLFKSYDNNIIFTICGSYRREKRYSSDIDIVISHKKYKTYESTIKNNLLNKIIALLEDNNILIPNINYKVANIYYGFAKLGKRPNRRIDITVASYSGYSFAILLTTGSYLFNEYINYFFKKYNITADIKKFILYDVNNNIIPIKKESDIFKLIKIDYIEPINRKLSYLIKHNMLLETDYIDNQFLKYLNLVSN